MSDINYEMILERMIDRVQEWAHQNGETVDTRESSPIRISEAPVAAEIMLMNLEIDRVLNEFFADTQSREFLIRNCAERGIDVGLATNAIRKGEFSMNIEIGSRFSLNELNYVAIKKLHDGIFEMECETPGNIGNLESGALIPIDYIDGLEWARLTDVLIPGKDDEATEHLRQRYYDSLESQAFGGNVQDYREKTLALNGVGGVKVYPVWNGGGTVKLVILDSTFNKPSSVLIDEVQTAIDPIPNQGKGLGLAPIGHVVTVEGVNEIMVNVKTNITYQTGWDWAAIKIYVEQAIDQYFLELSKSWDNVDWVNDSNATLVVRISQIETRLLNLSGVLDISDTSINNITQNLTLDVNAIPKRGDVTDG